MHEPQRLAQLLDLSGHGSPAPIGTFRAQDCTKHTHTQTHTHTNHEQQHSPDRARPCCSFGLELIFASAFSQKYVENDCTYLM